MAIYAQTSDLSDTVSNSSHGHWFIFMMPLHQFRRIWDRAHGFLSAMPTIVSRSVVEASEDEAIPLSCRSFGVHPSEGWRSGNPKEASCSQPSVARSGPLPLAVAPYRRAMVVVECLASRSMLCGVDAKVAGSATGQRRARKLASASRIHAEITNARRRRARPRKDNGLRIGSALPISMFKPCGELPPEGKTRLHKDETCDPLEGNCQEVYHVWESNCKTCLGVGDVKDLKGRWSTCPACNGIGCVRLSSSRLLPLLNGSSGPDFTLGRDCAWHFK